MLPLNTQLGKNGKKSSEESIILPGADCGQSASVPRLETNGSVAAARDVFSLSAFRVSVPSPPVMSGLLRGYWASLRSASPALRGCL